MSARFILTVNGGSSSLKCGLFSAEEREEPIQSFSLRKLASEHSGHAELLADVLAEIHEEYGVGSLAAVGHRVVHGGDYYSKPVVVDSGVMKNLQTLVPFAPLHQPINLRLVDACAKACPGIPQIACFDTSFHRQMPANAREYALPRKLTDTGIHAYGFHGVSYEYIVTRLRELDASILDKRIVVAHLGAGASLCAIEKGRSVATTMGFSTAEGLPMATRTGSIDPGVIVHLIREHGMSAGDLEQLIYQESGLLGMSGTSGGMQELQASNDPRARAAVDYFVYRIVREVGSLAAALGGLDMLVFTGGIGANDASIRKQVADGITWLNDSLDIRVIQASEEAMIAMHTLRIMKEQG